MYLIRTRNGSLYAGIATDVARRFSEHRSGAVKCARYLRGRGPLTLEYEAHVGSRSLALKLEARVKKLPKRGKEEIVSTAPDGRDLVEQLLRRDSKTDSAWRAQ